jgi:hypothetical protein
MSIKNRHAGRNDFDLIRALPAHPFDYTYLMWVLRSYRSPRDKVSRMLKCGDLLQIKRGLYILPPKFGGEIEPGVISNLIYGPSYVSLEYALSFWGLIPERVHEVTAMTNKRNKYFRTPLGAFSYKYINTAKFSPGVTLIKSEAQFQLSGKQSIFFLIATKEKALCDKLATVREIRGEADVADYLKSDLRIDPEAIAGLNRQTLKKIGNTYNKKSVTALVDWVARTKIT